MDVGEYLKELKKARGEKPEGIREALKVYTQMWESVLKKGLVRREDGVVEALRKIDSQGGLYTASSD
jgi:hypothetical protein